MRIAIAGSGRLGASMLYPLLESNHQIVCIVQDGRKIPAWRRALTPGFMRWFGGRNNMTGAARRLGIPIFWLDKMTPEALAPLRKHDIDVLLVAGFAIILKEPLLTLPKIGCVNMHSSLLPRHRGPNPFYAAVRDGDPESGVTFHVMEPGIDTGNILAQFPFPLTDEDTMFTVYHRSCQLASERVVEVMDRVEKEGLKGTPQDTALATYDKRPTVEDSWLDLTQPAEVLHRKIRAMAPSPMPRFMYGDYLVTVARSEINPKPVDAPPGTVLKNRPVVTIATGQGTITFRVAFCKRPVPWIWPSPWNRPKPGERLV